MKRSIYLSKKKLYKNGYHHEVTGLFTMLVGGIGATSAFGVFGVVRINPGIFPYSIRLSRFKILGKFLYKTFYYYDLEEKSY